MRKVSIKARITLWYTLIICVISVLALFIMASVSRNILIKDSENKLTMIVDRTISLINNPPANIPGDVKPPSPPKEKPPEPNDNLKRFPGHIFFGDGVHVAVYDENGVIINGAIPFEFADDIELKDTQIQEKTFDDDRYLTYVKNVPINNADYWAVGVISIADESVLMDSVLKTNLILTLLLISVAAFGGYLILVQAFKPVNTISSTAKLISESQDLSQRIALKGRKDEIHNLANTFDEMLEKIEKTLDNEKQFTSDASHELRTPVAVIASECEYTLECVSTLEEAKESVLSIKRQTDKMSKLISELLAISRMDKNTIDMNFENLDISELLNFVCDEQEEIHKENIALKRNIVPNIHTVTDSLLLARLFINLIDNSYSYGKENGNIEVSLEENNSNIIFKVSDDGMGIAEENLSKIWERFYQVTPSRTNENGSMGLGLSMVKLIADKLGGNITVKSALEIGTVFTFVMPSVRI